MLQSLPAWGAWVEMAAIILRLKKDYVAPRMGSVG